jgi:hypothetical protein
MIPPSLPQPSPSFEVAPGHRDTIIGLVATPPTIGPTVALSHRSHVMALAVLHQHRFGIAVLLPRSHDRQTSRIIRCSIIWTR